MRSAVFAAILLKCKLYLLAGFSTSRNDFQPVRSIQKTLAWGRLSLNRRHFKGYKMAPTIGKKVKVYNTFFNSQICYILMLLGL